MQDTEEVSVGQQPPEPALLGAPSDDHQRVAGVAGEVGEQLELLLRSEPADVPHQHPAVRRELPAQPLVAEPGVERVEVDAARPQRQPRHLQVLELSHAGRGRRQGPVHEGVDLAGQVGHRADAAGTEPGLGVPLGEPDQVGLVDRHARDAELLGRARGLQPERGRRGDVHHVGAEPQHLRTQAGPRLEADAEVPVERQETPREWCAPGTRRTTRGRSGPPARPRAPRARGAPAPGGPSW